MTSDGKKSGGRQAGTPNKGTSKLRSELFDIVEGNLDQLMVDLAEMKPTDRVKSLVDIMKFCLPTLKAVEFEDTTPRDPSSRFSLNFIDKSKEYSNG